MDRRRPERVAEAMREELDELIGYELTDPRIGQVTVTEVLIDPGMRRAAVRLQIAQGDRDRTIAALEGARGYLRSELARRLQLYRVPDLHFEADTEIEGGKIERLLRRVRRGRPREESG